MKNALAVCLLLFSTCLFSQTEICNDGIDNDGDGLIDCEDDDCFLSNSNECITCLGSTQTFADVVLSYNPVCPENHDPIVKDPQNAIGAPNYELPLAGQSFGTGFVSLGEGGSVELGFVDNILTNSGDSESDLYVFEVGTDIESMMVDLRPINSETINILEANGFSDSDSDGYYEISTIAGATSSLDIDALIPGQLFGDLKFDAVILTDVINTAGCIGSSGADIDAVCALTSTPAEICDNGIDDDDDGLTDCDDPDIADDCCCIEAETIDLGDDISLCQGESVVLSVEGEFSSYLWSDDSSTNTLSVNSDGIYWLEVIDACDNTIIDSITITVIAPVSITEMAEICDGETVEIYGQTYNTQGVYEQTIPGNNTCDTLLTVTIVEGESILATESAEICDGESIEINGETYDSAGIYEQILPGNNSCDTILTVSITVGESFEIIESYTINSGESVELNGQSYTESGSYSQNFTSATGCDSTVIVIISVIQNIVHYDFEDCLSNQSGESTIYSEFVAKYPDPLSCGAVQATNVYRENSTVNGHSCTEGINESVAMCVSSMTTCDYLSDSDLAIRFEIDITPGAGSNVQLRQLSFYEKAPEIFNWIDGGSGPNNYPTLYGIRILLNDVVILEETDIDATTEWSLEEYDLSQITSAQINDQSVLAVELIGYCATNFITNVTAWDIDEINLSALCSPTNTNRMIAGVVKSSSGEVIENVAVRRKEVENSSYQSIDNTGYYAFESDINTDYQLSANKVDQNMKGVSTRDLILIQNYMLGFTDFEHAYQYIAADINNSDNISGLDLVILRKLILGVKSDYPDNRSWTFVKPSSANESPWSISNQLDVSSGLENSLENNFVAIKIGDVSGILEDYNNDETLSDTRSENALKLESTFIESSEINNSNSRLDFHIESLENIHGFQLSLDLKGVEVEDITSDLINLTKNNYHITNDRLTISWSNTIPENTMNKPLFTIVGNISNDQFSALKMSNSEFRNEAYIGDELQELKIELAPRFNIENITSLTAQIHPNPMTDASNLIINSLEDGVVNIRIIDISGRLISQESLSVTKGNNTISYNKSQFVNSGLYCILINNGSEQIMQRIVVD